MPTVVVIIPFGPFEPDAAELNSPVLSRAQSINPSKTGYAPAKTFSAFVGGASAPAGGCVIQTGIGTYRVYVAEQTQIQAINSDTTAAVKGSGYSGPDAGEYWRGAKFGNFIIFVNENDDVQAANWSTNGTFAALAGSPPRATGVFTIGDFVFLTGLASNRRKLRWSEINNHTGWTVGTNLCDEQEFPDGGDVLGIAGDKNGFVIQQNCIRLFQFLPGDTSTIFEFHKVDGVPGCAGLFAWAKAGQSIFYYSEEGFCSIGPGGFRAIGAHRVDRYFLSKAPHISSMMAVADPYFPRIYFGYHTTTGGPQSGALIYDWQLDKWSEYGSGGTNGGSSSYMEHIDGTGGGAQMLIGGTILNQLGRWTGANRAATIVTSEMQILQSGPHAGKRVSVKAARPVIDGAVTSVIASHKEKLSDGLADATSTTQEAANGWFHFGTQQTSGTYHQFSVETTAANTATYHKGIEVKLDVPSGES